MIQVNQPIPEATLQERKNGAMISHNTLELFSDKKVVLFAVPGAFTPTCSEAHLPGYVVNFDEFKAKGVDLVICLSVNDAFVMSAWGVAQNAENIMMLADGDASYTKVLGLTMDTAGFGGVRSQRYAMIVDDGVVSQLFVEAPKAFEASTAENVLKHL